jgi:Porin PorA
VKGLVGKLFTIIGIVLIIAAILWWAFGANNLVKVPRNLDARIEFQGEDTFYVDPLTNEFLPAGQEIILPVTGYLTMVSQCDQYSSGKAVISGVFETNVSGREHLAPYTVVIDRKNCFNVADDRAYAFTESSEVDRSGSISYCWPIGTEKIDYPMWKEELAAPITMKFAGEEKKGGLHVYDFRGEVEWEEMASSYLEFAKLPRSMSFKEFAETTKALGLDIQGLIALAQQKLTPEEREILTRTMVAGVPLKYYLADEEEYSVDPKTGLIVDNPLWKTSISVKPDLAGLTDMMAVFSKYASDPALAPALQKFASADRYEIGFETDCGFG